LAVGLVQLGTGDVDDEGGVWGHKVLISLIAKQAVTAWATGWFDAQPRKNSLRNRFRQSR
jgi:hypothetical protein